MRTLKVEVNDTIFEKVMAFFNKLPKNEIQLSVEENREIQTPKKLSSFSLKTKGFKFNRDKANER
jgi:hypothetical protein